MIFETPDEQAMGLQYRPVIEAGTLFLFIPMGPGRMFHSRNVAEPFDIAFLGYDWKVLKKELVSPPHGTVFSPDGTAMAVEAKAGWLDFLGILPGRKVIF